MGKVIALNSRQFLLSVLHLHHASEFFNLFYGASVQHIRQNMPKSYVYSSEFQLFANFANPFNSVHKSAYSTSKVGFYF